MRPTHAALVATLLLSATAWSESPDRIMAPKPPPAPEEVPQLSVMANPIPNSAVSASLTLRVSDQEQAIQQAIDEAEKLGGYFITRQTGHVEVRIPTTSVDQYLKFAETLGTVAERTYQAQDMRSQMDQWDARLKSRTQMLDQYFKAMQGATASGVLQVEAEISRLVGDVEQLKGQIKLSRDQLAYARVSLVFQFQDRRAPETSATSSFQWINWMNLADLIQDFQTWENNDGY